jgi:carbon storage regulator
MIMLVLTRKLSEGIRIGDDILVKVIRTGKGSIKIGIDAPDDMRVVRAELFDEEVQVESKPVVKSLGKHQDSDGLSDSTTLGTLSVVEAARLVC